MHVKQVQHTAGKQAEGKPTFEHSKTPGRAQKVEGVRAPAVEERAVKKNALSGDAEPAKTSERQGQTRGNKDLESSQNTEGQKNPPERPASEPAQEPEDGQETASRFFPDVSPQDLVVQVRELFNIYRVGDSRVHALDGVDFDVKRGEFLTIVGTSGSGKSTLLNLLAGLESPSHGLIRLQGQNIVGMSEQELVAFRRDHVGFIFQSFNLIQSMTALENVALPLVFRGEPKRLREQKAAITLHMLGLSKHLYHKPSELSGGQQQRVGIARALVVNPKIIFADEPTGNLDSHTSQETMDLIQDLTKRHNQTFIMVTHDNNLAEYGDRIFRILDGKIVSVERGRQRYEVRVQEAKNAKSKANPA